MQNKDWSTVGQTDSGYTVGGGYDFGMVNVGATYEDYTYKLAAGDMKAKEWAVGLAVPLGPGKIGASYAKAKKLIAYFSQNMYVMEELNGVKGEFVHREDMLKGVEEIIV